MCAAVYQSAIGFRIEAFKWMLLVRLLLGEIPDRADFRQAGLTKALEPYFELTRAVRIGDLVLFKSVVEKYNDTFQKDKTLNLINRLRRNVIRTGLRRINLAYSRISVCHAVYISFYPVYLSNNDGDTKRNYFVRYLTHLRATVS